MLAEIAEMSQLGGRDLESIKAGITRRRDRARLAYDKDITAGGPRLPGSGNQQLRDPPAGRRHEPPIHTASHQRRLQRHRRDDGLHDASTAPTCGQRPYTPRAWTHSATWCRAN